MNGSNHSTVLSDEQPPSIASMTIGELLSAGTVLLAESGITHADNEAVWILESALGLDRLALHLKKREPVEERDRDHAMSLFARRASGEPLQYLLGTQEFCGLEFRVTPDVLIPRADTEILVEAVRQRCANKHHAFIADIGTGSGCIAIALARALPSAALYAIDQSRQALSLAQENACRHGVRDRVTFLLGDLFQPFQALGIQGRMAAIVSNPPYIPDPALPTLQAEVRLFEPHLALAGGSDGLVYHRRLIQEAAPVLAPGGWLAMEVGQGQARFVCDLAREGENYYNVQAIRDRAGIERVVLMRKS